MIFLCRTLTAEEAVNAGLINKAVPQTDLLEETMAWCERIKSYSSQTLRATKKSLNFESDELYASWQHGMELSCQHWISQAFKAASNFGVPVGVSIASLCEPSETNRYKVNSANCPPQIEATLCMHSLVSIALFCYCTIPLFHYSIVPCFQYPVIAYLFLSKH